MPLKKRVFALPRERTHDATDFVSGKTLQVILPSKSVAMLVLTPSS